MGFEINIYTHIYVYLSTRSSDFIAIISWPHLKSVRLTQWFQFLWSVNNTITNTAAGWLKGWLNKTRGGFTQWKMPEIWVSSYGSGRQTDYTDPEVCLHKEKKRFTLARFCWVSANGMSPALRYNWTTPCHQRPSKIALALSGSEATFSRRRWSPPSYLPSPALDLQFFLKPLKFLLSQNMRSPLLGHGTYIACDKVRAGKNAGSSPSRGDLPWGQ